MTARIKAGTAAWADRRLVESKWYPDDVRSSEAKLRYYASQFPLVENDSTYWAFPDADRIATWAERTVAAKPRVYPKDLGDDVMRELTKRFRESLAPLADAGRLGVVLFQFPVWFPISGANKHELHRIRDDFDGIASPSSCGTRRG